MKRPLIVAITGASGAVYARRLLEVLLADGRDVHLTISRAGQTVIQQELEVKIDLEDFRAEQLIPQENITDGKLIYHRHDDFMSPIASGSFLTDGMVVCPCSGGTLSAIVHGASTNLTQRAADVQLKEGRKLILVPRETPLSMISLDNMRRACEVGAVVLPAMPGWYHGVESLQDLIDFVVARILDQLNVEHNLMRRWGEANDV